MKHYLLFGFATLFLSTTAMGGRRVLTPLYNITANQMVTSGSNMTGTVNFAGGTVNVGAGVVNLNPGTISISSPSSFSYISNFTSQSTLRLVNLDLKVDQHVYIAIRDEEMGTSVYAIKTGGFTASEVDYGFWGNGSNWDSYPVGHPSHFHHGWFNHKAAPGTGGLAARSIVNSVPAPSGKNYSAQMAVVVPADQTVTLNFGFSCAMERLPGANNCFFTATSSPDAAPSWAPSCSPHLTPFDDNSPAGTVIGGRSAGYSFRLEIFVDEDRGALQGSLISRILACGSTNLITTNASSEINGGRPF